MLLSKRDLHPEPSTCRESNGGILGADEAGVAFGSFFQTGLPGLHVHDMFSFMEWPGRIPDDLEKGLVELESFRFAVQSQDRWTVIREWLETHEVPAPAELPQAAEIRSGD